jgi:Rieske Fe-S protein
MQTSRRGFLGMLAAAIGAAAGARSTPAPRQLKPQAWDGPAPVSIGWDVAEGTDRSVITLTRMRANGTWELLGTTQGDGTLTERTPEGHVVHRLAGPGRVYLFRR